MTEKKKTDWASEARQLALLALAVFGIHSFIAKPFYIPSESMLPGLINGDRLIVSKFPYGYSSSSPSWISFPQLSGRLFNRAPERGDIAVIKSPRDHVDYIKRVIGVAGDTVEMRDGQLWLNGAAVPKLVVTPNELLVSPNTSCNAPFRVTRDDGVTVCRYPTFRETLPNGVSYNVLDLGPTPQDNVAPTIVPEGHIFLMGDNRDNSEDSRFAASEGGLEMLPIENLVGRAEFTTFSLDGSTSFNPLTWWTALRGERAFRTLRPAKG